MSGGIIIQRRAALLTAAKEPCMYDNLPAGYKAKVDAIDLAPPSQCTEHDLETLTKVLRVAVAC